MVHQQNPSAPAVAPGVAFAPLLSVTPSSGRAVVVEAWRPSLFMVSPGPGPRPFSVRPSLVGTPPRSLPWWCPAQAASPLPALSTVCIVPDLFVGNKSYPILLCAAERKWQISSPDGVSTSLRFRRRVRARANGPLVPAAVLRALSRQRVQHSEEAFRFLCSPRSVTVQPVNFFDQSPRAFRVLVHQALGLTAPSVNVKASGAWAVSSLADGLNRLLSADGLASRLRALRKPIDRTHRAVC
jgi:hypothetical protein